MNGFKAGDKVYYPQATNAILHVSSDLFVSYIGTDDMVADARIDHGGKFYNFHHNAAFFPATQEWYDKLVHVYPNLEKPPIKKDPKEIIQAMLDDGWRAVPCLVNDHEPNLELNNSFIELINRASNAFSVFKQEISWLHAQPIDLKTFKKIIDYADGKVILED